MSDPARGNDDTRAFFVAFIPGALIIVLAFFMFQMAFERHQSLMNALCEGEAGWVEAHLGRGLDARAVMIERLAAERAEGGETWREGAVALTTGPLKFRAVIEYDSTLAYRGVTPADLRLLSTLGAGDDGVRAVALKVAAASRGREAVVVSTAPLASGERQVLVCAPVVRGSTRLGWVVGLVRLRDVLDEGLSQTVQRGFSAAVYEGPTLLYGANSQEGGPGARYARDVAVLRGPLLWRVQLWPAEDLAREYESQAPQALFVSSFLLACFVALSLYLWRRRPV